MDDRTAAAALKIAERELKRLGWKFCSEDIGKKAAQILKAMQKEKDQPNDQ